MDAQEFYSLSEAYNQVHQLDEVLDTPEKATEYGKKALGSMLGATAKALITKDKKYLKTVEKRTKGVEAAKRKAEKKAEEEAKESYDIILSHLLDEGYASSPEAADKIILNMSESWFEDIMELSEARAEEKRGLGSTGAQRQRQKKGVVTSSGEVAHPATSYSGGQNPQLRGKEGKTKEQRRASSRRYVDQPGGIYAKPENKQGEGRYAAKQSKKRPDLGSRYD
jgi:hypothetical protein